MASIEHNYLILQLTTARETFVSGGFHQTITDWAQRENLHNNYGRANQLKVILKALVIIGILIALWLPAILVSRDNGALFLNSYVSPEN